jgi:putative membrane protein
MAFLTALVAFLGHLVVALVMTALFLWAYMLSTPHDEIRLIRTGNAAAAIGLGGALIGFAIVLARAITSSNWVGEVVIWGAIGLAVQVAGHVLLSRLMPRLYAAIDEGELAAGVFKAAVAVSLGLINAASMTP